VSRPKTTDPTPAPTGKAAEIMALLSRAREGDESCMPELQALFDRAEAKWVELLVGDMAEVAERALIGQAAGRDLAFREAASRALAARRRELAGPAPSALEAILAERLAICWLAVHLYEAVYAKLHGILSIAEDEHYQKKIDAAHRRFLSAARALATVRRLAIPALQVNLIAENQEITHPVVG
jgi:hypothetical protein